MYMNYSYSCIYEMTVGKSIIHTGYSCTTDLVKTYNMQQLKKPMDSLNSYMALALVFLQHEGPKRPIHN